MLTFEEFFQKKKINLVRFQAAEPGLFTEFNKHYPLMGEKSFDHTKKYWFNNLRRSYPLAEEPKPHKVQAEAISQTAVQGVAVAAAQNVDAGIERPKFKEDNLPELVDENVSVKEVSLAEEEKSIIDSELEKSEEEKSEERESKPAKPAFKPRFNMQNIKKETVKEASEAIISSSKNINPTTKNSEPATESDLTKSMDKSEDREHVTEPAKPAFKPRFKMQNIKKEPVKTVSEEITSAENIKPATENPELAKPEQTIENPETTENKEAKPVYKPRFQIKNMPKPPQDNQV